MASSMKVVCRVVPLLLVAACQKAPRPSSHAHSEPAPTQRAIDPPVTGNERGAISGIVIDASGHPVRGARIALVPIGLFDLSGAAFVQSVTGADGTFRVAAGAQRYGVTATTTDGAAWLTDVKSDASGLRLQLADAGRRVAVRVRDRQGRPRAGVEIRLARVLGDEGDVFLGETAADGQWTTVVPDGNYHASAATKEDAAAQRALPRGRDSVELVLEPIGPPGPTPPAVAEWLRMHAFPIQSVDPGHGGTDLAPLRSVVGDARAVGLGEVSHGTREIFRIKHRLVEYLVRELGFTVFAVEFGLVESFAIDDYVLGGPGEPERLLARQSPVWRTEEIADLLRWMREWNRTHARKVRFHGLDMRAGNRAAKDAPAHDAESRWRASMQSEVQAQMLAWRAATNTAESVRVRERSMAENFFRVLEHRGSDARGVVWAQNSHITGDREAAPQTLGVHLRARLGTAYRAVGTAIHHGAYHASDATGKLRDFTIAPAAAGSIEDALYAAGRPLALLDLRAVPANGAVAEWFRAWRGMRLFDALYDDARPAGWGGTRAIVGRDYDALVFVAEGTLPRKL